ncbi:acyl-CoA dehydrogenase [Mycolicibacterium rhodesiae NBB3]|uniref:Acyl-CoA dehydrogenase n=1 Tax=Mycolicibacterium rhodesiae (strain NBB3) TaxID=710685 RepID=G8RGJ3_MYCRN|nr:acyl-CoA dehydrogenase family protein [Mycolicibacterium rhodesiae]AEV70762.1 acyl-CoA dehydrogenase [Mycolicibacterium rhodesiae NBB3]
MSTATASEAEIQLFVSTTRAFLDREMSIEHIRDLNKNDRGFDKAWWRRGAELGWTSLLVPEDLGGGCVTGDPVTDAARIAEQFGRSVAPGPLIPISAVATALAEASNSAAHHTLLASLIEGSAIAACAVDEPGRAFGTSPTTTATRSTDGYCITGVKDRVEAAQHCDVFLISAVCEGALRQFVVASGAPGVSIERIPTVDFVKDYGRVRFDNVEVVAESVVGGPDETAQLMARQTLVAQVLQCAEMVGALDSVFTMTVAWARDRHSFGRPLASYQALKHRFADLKTQLEACRAIAARAARDVSARAENAALTVSAAKAYIGEYSVAIMQDCIQLHGGIGVTWEHDLHLFLRRIEVNRALFGTTEEHQENVFALSEKLGKAK